MNFCRSFICIMLAWIACGVLAAGGMNATWRHNHPGASARDCLIMRNSAFVPSLFLGPLAVGVVLNEVGFADGITFDANPTPSMEKPHA